MLRLNPRETALSLWSLGSCYEKSIIDTAAWLGSSARKMVRNVFVARVVVVGEGRIYFLACLLSSGKNMI